MSSIYAIVDPKTGAVLNTIMAEDWNFAPSGTVMIPTEGKPVDQNYVKDPGADTTFTPNAKLQSDMSKQQYEWNGDTKTFEPNTQLKTQLDAEAAAVKPVGVKTKG